MASERDDSPASGDEVVYKGAKLSIAYAVAADGSKPAKSFLEDCDQSDAAKLKSLIERLGDHGKIVNREQFKKVDGKIWEFKSYQIRISCFREGQTWYLAHGFIKKSDKWPTAEVDRAARIQREHLERKQKQERKQAPKSGQKQKGQSKQKRNKGKRRRRRK